jgi:hypothetical protein
VVPRLLLVALAVSVSLFVGCGGGGDTTTGADQANSVVLDDQGSAHSPQSRAEDLASCLQDNGVQAYANGYGSGSVVIDGQTIDTKEADVSLLPKRGPGPPDRVALFDSAKGGRIWADEVTQTARKKGQSKVVVRLAGDSVVLVSTGVSPHRPTVQNCVDQL